MDGGGDAARAPGDALPPGVWAPVAAGEPCPIGRGLDAHGGEVVLEDERQSWRLRTGPAGVYIEFDDGLFRHDPQSGLLTRMLAGQAKASFNSFEADVDDPTRVYIQTGAVLRSMPADGIDVTSTAIATLADATPTLERIQHGQMLLSPGDDSFTPIMTYDLATGQLLTVLTDPTWTLRVERTADHVYYLEYPSRHVFRVPVAGGDPVQVTVDADLPVLTFSLDETTLYLSHSDGAVIATDLDGMGSRRPIMRREAGVTRHLMVSGDNVYWSDGRALGWVKRDGSRCGWTMNVPGSWVGWGESASGFYSLSSVSNGGSELVRFQIPQ